MDIVDAATRSRMMRGIRGKDTRPERYVRSLLHRHGFRFRKNVRKLKTRGEVDIVLPRYRAVILVHGCFWHGHDCVYFKLPASNPEYWTTKIERNRSGDKCTEATLRALGWRVCTVWECTLRGKTAWPDEKLITSLAKWLRSEQPTHVLAGTRTGA